MRERLRAIAQRVEGFTRLLLAESQRARRAYPVVLLLFTVIVWFPSLFGGLDLANPDDFYHITQAALHHSPEDVAKWFTRGYWAYTHFEYRPLTRLSLLANHLIAGPRPWAFHLGNVLLHFACALLLAALMVLAGAPIWGARLSGAVAAVFPPGQMAVIWINGRQDLLCGVLLLAGLYFFLRWLGGRHSANLLGAAGCAVLSALAKEPGATAPIIILAVALLFPTKRTLSQRLLAVGVVSVLLLPYVWLRLKAWPMDQYLAQNAPQLRPLKVGLVWLFRDLLAPRPYEIATEVPAQGLYILFARAFHLFVLEQVAFWAGLVVLMRRRRRLLALGIVWQIALFLPVYNLYWNPAFKHYRYLPHLGTAMLVGLAAWELAGWSARRMHNWGRPLVRWSVVAVGLALLLWYYIGQLDLRRPPWWLIKQGGPKPPPAFCRDLHGERAPSFDESAVYPPGERPRQRD
jgi:hypothetical protein